MTQVKYKMLNVILLTLTFGIGLHLVFNSHSIINVKRECLATRYKFNNTEHGYNMYAHITTSDDNKCYEWWELIYSAPIYREMIEMFDWFVVLYPPGHTFTCQLESDNNGLKLNGIQFLSGFLLVITSLILTILIAKKE